MKGRIVYSREGGREVPRFFADGREVTREEFDRLFPPRPAGDGSGLIGWKPVVSDALAVHPGQVAEATEDAKRKGVPTDFLPDGRPILRSRQHRRAYLKAYGFHDNDGGYGDG